MLREAVALASLYLASVLLFLALGGHFDLTIALVMAAVIFLGRFVYVRVIHRRRPLPQHRE